MKKLKLGIVHQLNNDHTITHRRTFFFDYEKPFFQRCGPFLLPTICVDQYGSRIDLRLVDSLANYPYTATALSITQALANTKDLTTQVHYDVDFSWGHLYVRNGNKEWLWIRAIFHRDNKVMSRWHQVTSLRRHFDYLDEHHRRLTIDSGYITLEKEQQKYFVFGHSPFHYNWNDPSPLTKEQLNS